MVRAPTQSSKRLHECCKACLSFRIVREVHQHSDAAHALGLLRPRREWPCRHATEERDEIAPPHSITSSARASSVGGTSRPSAFAAVRLINSRSFVGNSIGRSPGLAPFIILSTNAAVRRQLSRTSTP